MLGVRLATGLSMVAILLGVLWLDESMAPWYPIFFVTAMVAAGAATLEMVSLLGATMTRPSANTAVAGSLAVVVANWLPHITEALGTRFGPGFRPQYDPSAPVDALAWPLWTFVAVLMFAFIGQSIQFRRPGSATATIAGTILAVAYVGLLGTFTIQARWLDGPYHGVVPLLFLVAVSKGADTGAYTLGRIAGRHKLWPRISPNKTIEGAVGGLIFGVLAALIVATIVRNGLYAEGLTYLEAIGYGVVVGTAAQLGDLMESMVKRDGAQKDASSTLPGFGGVLDVLDSLLFAGPVAFGYWLWFGA